MRVPLAFRFLLKTYRPGCDLGKRIWEDQRSWEGQRFREGLRFQKGQRS